jgi:hypothetical protein
MSGALAAAATAITAAATAALDADAPDQPVSLGSFVFQGFEVPEMVTWGGAQKLVVHKLIGGKRVIDSMGPDNAELSWSSIFLSSDASIRASQLDLMRKFGSPLELLFGDRYYIVVISDFSAEFRRLSYVPYKISCTILSDLSDNNPFADSLVDSVTFDINYASAFEVSTALAGAHSLIGLAANLLLPIVDLAVGAVATVAVGAAVGLAANAIGAVAEVASETIGGLTEAAITTGVLLGTTAAVAAGDVLITAAAATATAAGAAVLGAYVGRAAVNIALA